MALAVLDKTAVITEINDEFAEHVLHRKASVGTSFVGIFEEDDRKSVEDALACCTGGGMEKISGRIFACGSGPNEFPVLTRFTWTVFKHNDGFLATASREGENKGNAEVEELKDFFNKAPIALHWLAGNGKVLWANDRELEVLGYSREEYIGSDIMDFCPDSKEDVLEIFHQLGSGNTIRDIPVRFRTKTGKIQDLLIDSNVNYKSDGSFNHTRCFIRDDTGRILREARQEAAAAGAEKLSLAKEKFSSKLLHEVKTPLHVMTMSMSDPTSPVDVPLIGSQLRSLLGLVDSVAKAMKFHDGFFVKKVPAPVNLSSLIGEYRKAQGVKHEITVEELGFDQTLVVLADASMLRTVLDELIAHADGRSPAGATIRLSVERTKEGREGGDEEGDHFEFKVVDSGKKLDESRVEKVFHSYWLLDAAASEQTETKESTVRPSSQDSPERVDRLSGEDSPFRVGRLSSNAETPGLRLNVAFNYVQCLDSTLRVVSDSSTTTFKFTLTLEPSVLPGGMMVPPIREARHHWSEISPSNVRIPSEPNPSLFPKHQPGTSVYSSARRHILIVEDNTICQKMCVRIVKRLGHTSDTADNGAEAVEKVAARAVNIYDLVLMDIRMPVMDGITAAQKIHEVFPELHIVAFSAEEGETTRAEALATMSEFIKKPANSDQIKEVIERHARRPLVRSIEERLVIFKQRH